MLSDFIKFYFIFFNNVYICFKIINHSINKPFYKKVILFLPIFLTIVALLCTTYLPEISYISPIILLWLCISLQTNQPKETFISSIIAFALSYSFYAIATAVGLLFLSPIFYQKPDFPFTILALSASSIQTCFTIKLFKMKRFRKGVPALFSTTIINVATTLCLLLVAVSMYISFNRIYPILQALGITSFILALAFLIHWWQAQITKSYKQSLVMRELDSLRVEVEEKDKEISRLKAQNEELGRLIHHDNKRIPAMETAVCEYLVSDFSDINAMKERANVLRLEIESLSRNRSNTLKEIYAQKSRTYSTGINSIDTLLNYMDKRATDTGIQFNVHNTLKLETYIPKLISVEDFTHVLSDLLENAIIATEYSANKTIQLQFYVSEKHFVIEVADSGIPFEAKSIVNFGLSKLTTHEATGGSGIGLMDIWKIKESCGASLHIEEYETPAPFTKKLSMIFNHKNMYSVRTYRAEEITTLSKRNDLRVYTFND